MCRCLCINKSQLNPAGNPQELLEEAGALKREGDERRKESCCLLAHFSDSDGRGLEPS